jgi:haloalkane dehalogenase
MLRLYLPLNLKRGPLSERERAAYFGPFPPERRGHMRVFPRDLVAGRSWLRQVEANLPRLADKPALIVWPDSDPGFGEAELRRWQSLFPRATTVRLERVGQFIDEDAPDDVAAAVERWWAAGFGQEAIGLGAEVSASDSAAPRGRRRS